MESPSHNCKKPDLLLSIIDAPSVTSGTQNFTTHRSIHGPVNWTSKSCLERRLLPATSHLL